MQYDPTADVRAVEAMAANLTPYLYEKELYGMISNDLPRLTIGALLMRLHRLETLQDSLTPDQRQRVQNARQQLEQMRSEWRTHYEDKLIQEIQVRLNGLSAFVEEYADDKQQARSAYPAEATYRLIVEALVQEAQHLNLWSDELKGNLSRLDARLRGLLDKDSFTFVPPKGLEEVYPQDTYWWLYAYPATN